MKQGHEHDFYKQSVLVRIRHSKVNCLKSSKKITWI